MQMKEGGNSDINISNDHYPWNECRTQIVHINHSATNSICITALVFGGLVVGKLIRRGKNESIYITAYERKNVC